MKVGARVRALRRAQSFTFDAFVEETGLGRGYISELERGLVVPTIYALAKMAGALEVTVADLVLGETEREVLFGELRDTPDATVRELRAHARKIGAYAAPAERVLDVADGARTRRAK